MTVSVFEAVNDGYIRSNSIVYATARTGGTLTVDNTDTILRVGQSTGYNVYQAFVEFDTTIIPPEAIIDLVTFEAWIVNDQGVNEFVLNVYSSDWGGGDVTSADWVSGANLGSPRLATDMLLAQYSSTEFVNGQMQAALAFGTGYYLRNGIIRGGMTRYFLFSSSQLSALTPTANGYVDFASKEDSNSAHRPKLTVTWHMPSMTTYPVYVNAGGQIGNPSVGVTCPSPASVADDDLLVLIVAACQADASGLGISGVSAWNAINDTTVAGAVDPKLWTYWRIAKNEPANYPLTFTGPLRLTTDGALALILRFAKGTFDRDNPINAKSESTTNTPNIIGLATTVEHCLLLQLVCTGHSAVVATSWDSATDTEIYDGGWDAGNAVSLAIGPKQLPSARTWGTWVSIQPTGTRVTQGIAIAPNPANKRTPALLAAQL